MKNINHQGIQAITDKLSYPWQVDEINGQPLSLSESHTCLRNQTTPRAEPALTQCTQGNLGCKPEHKLSLKLSLMNGMSILSIFINWNENW